jgi:hypothetical protein
MLWKIPRRGDPDSTPLYLYILMEFQSSIDAMMPIRMLTYIGLIYEHLGRQDSGMLRRGGLPPILPIVLYNGASRWSAETSVREMIQVEAGSALSTYMPALQFYLVDEGRLDREALRRHNTILAGLFRIETLKDPEELRAQVFMLGDVVRRSNLNQIRGDVLIWLDELLRSRGLLLEPQQIQSFEETDPMLSQALDEWREKLRQEGLKAGLEAGRQEGRQEGHERALRELLVKQLQLRFGDDEGRAARVEALDIAELDIALERILSAQDEAAVFSP